MQNFLNAYCDLIKSAAYSFYPVEDCDEALFEAKFNEEELAILARYVLDKNASKKVSKLFLKSPKMLNFSLFDEFGIDVKLVLPFDELTSLKTSDFVGERLMLDLPSLLEESDSRLSQMSDLSAKLKIPIVIGFGQTLEEVGILTEKYKLSPVRILEDFGFLDRKCFLIGCNFIDKDDLELISSYGGEIILSPRSDMMLGKGAVNLLSLENKGIDYHFASDCRPDIDMLMEGEIARGNTANLLYERGLIPPESLQKALGCTFEGNFPFENVFEGQNFAQENEEIRAKAKEIIKEKIWKS